ncbi:hypothetical protein J3Q64DRAFT_1704017 [Phycomyces blakesleeanus]|uniref:Uncharacterized protein n=2 Tax=Phycomyces blakesleeanus TaxID=4837 RepID=A0A167LYE2_PHYB8|nr:hypothetical protein PHYBLDRAFT_170711 [Phycomyces blakesleeanus NRRL 1555(-)]OAD71347.1 hypothetical protein PHYBLDRAFT_170711 [Phycomyces blakesleeanus NRRL 1555(-)]|eukprot:XP_018289387.1 hypothetical protein PHYBLDRAFT_170711 [Phycomyces blakesleeanus NRRL 1555(-)]
MPNATLAANSLRKVPQQLCIIKIIGNKRSSVQIENDNKHNITSLPQLSTLTLVLVLVLALTLTLDYCFVKMQIHYLRLKVIDKGLKAIYLEHPILLINTRGIQPQKKKCAWVMLQYLRERKVDMIIIICHKTGPVAQDKY